MQESYLCLVPVAVPRFAWAPFLTWHCFRSAAVAVMALANICPGLYCRSGVTLESVLIQKKIGCIPEYPRKQMVPTVQSLLWPLGPCYSPFPTKKESRMTCRTRKSNNPWNTVRLGGMFHYLLKDGDDIHGWGAILITLEDRNCFPHVTELF